MSSHPGCSRQSSCITNADASSGSSDTPEPAPLCCRYSLTSAPSVLSVPALSTAAAPAPAAAPAVAPPTGAGPATLVALSLAMGFGAALPVPLEVTPLALIPPPVVAAPVWASRRGCLNYISESGFKNNSQAGYQHYVCCNCLLKTIHHF